MKHIFRCDCIVLLAQLIEHVEGSLMMYVCTIIQIFYMANHANLGIFLCDFTSRTYFEVEVSPFHVRMYCIPCCGPELGASLAVEDVLSLFGVFCFPVV